MVAGGGVVVFLVVVCEKGVAAFVVGVGGGEDCYCGVGEEYCGEEMEDWRWYVEDEMEWW